MGRPGEFFDQDEENRPATSSAGPLHSGHGMLYDQDRPGPGGRRDPAAEARRRQAMDRQRDREIELRRQLEWEREREERRRRARESQKSPGPPGPVRISSRPGAQTIRIGGRAPEPPPPPAPPRRTRPASRGDRPPGGGSMGRDTTVLAAGTFASRLTGFFRVLAIGYVLGVGSLSDAFNYANGVPNIIYDLLLGGILTATLVPVFVEMSSRADQEDETRSVSAVVTAVAAALAAISALLWLLAPWVIDFYLLLNPASTGPAERALATRLLHFFAPQVFFLGAIVVSTALLNARRRFAAAAFSPVVNNLIAIAALLATKAVASGILTAKHTTAATTLQRFGHAQQAILILGIGTTIGYVAQLLVQLPAMHRAGVRVRFVWDLRHPAVRKVLRLSTWLVGVVVANQVSLALVMILAGRTEGGVTAYQFSYQFFQLPYALIAVSVASALMPDLSSRWTAGDRAGFERQFVSGLRVTLALIVPVGVAYVAIAQPFIQLAIHHGRVTSTGAHLVSTSLALFAVGLPGFSAFFLLMRAYQAMQDTRSMFWLYALENAITVVAALVLEPLLGVPGLALAWVAPYSFVSVVAAVDLRRKIGPMGGVHTVRSITRITIASALSVLAVVVVGLPFRPGAGDAVVVVRLLLQVGAGAAAYLAIARVMHISELRPVMRMVKRFTG